MTYDDRWSILVPSVLDLAAEDPELHGPDVRVLVKMLGQLSLMEWRQVKHLWVARKVGCSDVQVGRCVDRLIGRGYLERLPDTGPGKVHSYRASLSPRPAAQEAA